MGADSRDSFTAQLLTEDTTPAYRSTAVSRVKPRDKPLETAQIVQSTDSCPGESAVKETGESLPSWSFLSSI